jgi:predicted nucleic acid-binding Zn ribbon protein
MDKSEAGKLGYENSKLIHAERNASFKKAYEDSPKRCPNCNATIPYAKRDNKFCCMACAATFNNRQRGTNAPTAIPTPRNPGEPCVVCGKPIKSGGKYCSLACHVEDRKRKKNEEIVAGIAKNARQVKRYLIEQHGERCMSPTCAWDFEKMPVNVEIEHIDGDASNNTLDNVILLCPNCHSLTPTYKGKNKGNGRYRRRQRYAEGKSY